MTTYLTEHFFPPKNRVVYTCNYPINCNGGLLYNGSCFEGQAGVDSCDVTLCSGTSMGPLCGKCKREDPPSYMKDARCYRCEGGEVAVVISAMVMCVMVPLLVALVLYRFTRARALTYRIYRRVFDIGRFKVVRICLPLTSPSPMVRLSSFRAHGRNRTTSDERALTIYVRVMRLAMN